MAIQELKHAEITGAILTAFYRVYNDLGYGFVEARYAAALDLELRNVGRHVTREYATRVYYRGHEVGFHRLDMVVDLAVVIEIKSTPVLLPYARRQLQNYLKSTNLEVGMLLHFGPKPRFERIYWPNNPINRVPEPRLPSPWENDAINDLIELERQLEAEADEEAREEWGKDDEGEEPGEPDADEDPPTAVPG
jgi:GxxExxY protein